VRYLKPVKGGRRQIGSRVEREIRRRVERDAASHDCSMSYVVNTILAMYYKVKVEEKFNEYK
jgi:hypothetical protein